MAIASIKGFLAQHNLATPQQFDEWHKAWRVAGEGGSTDTLLVFMARERGNSEEAFLQDLAKALGWPFIDLAKTECPSRGPQKNLHQGRFSILRAAGPIRGGPPARWSVSNPFDAAMLSAVQFDARVPGAIRA